MFELSLQPAHGIIGEQKRVFLQTSSYVARSTHKSETIVRKTAQGPHFPLRLTRKQSEQRYYGSCPCDLSKTEPSIHKQLIQFFYHLNMTEVEPSFCNFILRISNDLISIWQAVSKSSTPFDFYQSYPQKSKRLTEFGEGY